ncbi:MAG: hypothetical protein WC444_05705 [Candidatus Paceibacterota bacterium]
MAGKTFDISSWNGTKKKDEIVNDISEAEIDEAFTVMDPNVIALCGKDSTCKSSIICDFASNLPKDKKCLVFDMDGSINKIISTHYPHLRDRFIVVSGTTCGDDYRRGLKIGMSAVKKTLEVNKGQFGLLAFEGVDRLKQRSFKMMLQAKNIPLEKIKYFGKKEDDTIKVSAEDWNLRNDYIIEAFELIYFYARDNGLDMIVTTHTEDKVNEKREIVKEDVPIWYKTFPDYISYRFIIKRIDEYGTIKRIALLEKTRGSPELEGRKYTISKTTPGTGNDKSTTEFVGLYSQIRDDFVLNMNEEHRINNSKAIAEGKTNGTVDKV